MNHLVLESSLSVQSSRRGVILLQGLKQHWLLISAGVVALPLLWTARQPLLSVVALVGDQEALRQAAVSFGAWGPALLALLQFLQILIAIIPGQVILVASGYLYGFGAGLLFNVVTTVVASQIVFTLARHSGRPLVARFVPLRLIDRFDGVVERHGVLFFLVNFLIPVIPGDVLNLVAGVSAISARRFLFVNAVGRLPGIALMTLIGSHGVQLPPMVWAVIGLLLPLVVFGVSMGLPKLETGIVAS